MKTDKFGTVVRNSVFCNAKFNVGDKVKTELGGRLATITAIGRKVSGDQSYHIKYDGSVNEDVVFGYEIKAANSVAHNDQFKVGDKVLVKDGPLSGNEGVIQSIDGFNVKVDCDGVMTKVALGSLAKNSVSRNAETEVSARDVKVGQTIDTDEAIGIVKEVKGGWVYYETAYGMKKIPTASRVILINSSDPFLDKTPGTGDRVYLYVVGKNRTGTVVGKTPGSPWKIRVKWDNGDVDDLNPLEVRILNSVTRNANEGFAKSDWAKYTFRQLGDCYANVRNLVTRDCPPELSRLIGLAASAIASAQKESKKYL